MADRPARTGGAAVRAVAGAGVFLAVAAVAFAGWTSALPHAGRVGPAGSGLWVAAIGGASVVWALTGAVLALLRPRNIVGWLILGVGVTSACEVGLVAYGGYGTSVADPAWPAAHAAVFLAGGMFVPGWLVPPTLLMAFYPDGNLPRRWWRLPVAAATAGTVVLTFTSPFDPEPHRYFFPHGPPPASLPPAVLTALLEGVCLPLLVLSGIAIWIGTLVRLARARSPQRQQLALLVCLEGFQVVAIVLTVPDVPRSVIAATLPLAMTVGVLRYRLLGIETVLRRGLVYGALTGCVIVVYLVATAVVGSALDRRPLPGVVAAALVAGLLSPMRDRLQRAADRFVYGAREDPLRAVTRLGDEIAGAEELDLLSAALRVVVGALRAPGAVVVGSGGRVLNSVGAQPVAGRAMPLRVGGRDVGTLTVGERAPEETYSDAELRLLSALALQIAVLVRALELTEALEAERDRVVSATRGERARLQHDLHDGLGPSLSGMGLGLQALSEALARGDTATCGELLDRIRAEVTLSIGEIRRIIDGLRPTVLDALGLIGAVREQARTVSLVVPVDVTAVLLPRLPPDVETAAYRIVTEALTNTVRHAHARRAAVAIALDGTSLRVVVSDDGRGVSEAAAGVGLASMRRRTEALHGVLTVTSGGAGTTVTATFPLRDGSCRPPGEV
ncbi:histidine kinase [Streptomyces sp. NPDC005485]|uniref:histidine kinase n=1 Tax=Streptomyces sp. NPDC005485 TaxID=3155591 RepID=UPI0033AEEDF6